MELGDILNHIERLESCLKDVECDDGDRDDCAMHLSAIYRRCGKALYEFVQTDEQLEILIDSVVADGLTSLWAETGTMDPYLIRLMRPQFSDYTIKTLEAQHRDKLRENGLIDQQP